MMMANMKWFLGGPLVIYVVLISIICTVAFKFVQITHFFRALQALFSIEKTRSEGGMTPFDAFLNTLSSNLGNGSIAGAAVAVFTGGPGAALWVLIIGLLLMAIRFAEIYISTLASAKAPANTVLGGPMLYLRDIAGGKFLAAIYAVTCLLFSLIVGNAMQAHAIAWSVQTTWGVTPKIVAVVVTLFIGYVTLGGSHRIIAVSDRIVPVKVLVFFFSTAIVIAYHSAVIMNSLTLIVQAALSPIAWAGGIAGFTVMQAIQSGMNLSLTATESGLGTSAILFGYTGSKNPMRSALMGMMSTFISSIVCFTVALCIVMSGVWNSGLTSTALTIASFNTVFGSMGGWIVSFLSISFGIGVLVSFAYISRAAFMCVTNGRYGLLFPLLYCVASFLGAMADVHALWSAVAVINAILLIINTTGLLVLIPKIRADMLTRR